MHRHPDAGLQMHAQRRGRVDALHVEHASGIRYGQVAGFAEFPHQVPENRPTIAPDVGAAQHAQGEGGRTGSRHIAAFGRHVQQITLGFHRPQQAHQGAFRHPHHGGQLRQGQRLRGFAEVLEDGQRPQAPDVLARFLVLAFLRLIRAGLDPCRRVILTRQGLASLDVPSPRWIFPCRPVFAGDGSRRTLFQHTVNAKNLSSVRR